MRTSRPTRLPELLPQQRGREGVDRGEFFAGAIDEPIRLCDTMRQCRGDASLVVNRGNENGKPVQDSPVDRCNPCGLLRVREEIVLRIRGAELKAEELVVDDTVVQANPKDVILVD